MLIIHISFIHIYKLCVCIYKYINIFVGEYVQETSDKVTEGVDNIHIYSSSLHFEAVLPAYAMAG